jgi:hypothetical protein
VMAVSTSLLQWVLWLTIIPGWLLIVGIGNEWFYAFLREPSPVPAVAVLGASSALCFWAGHRLTTLTEEDAAYWSLRPMNDGTNAAVASRGRNPVNWLARLRDNRLERLLQRPRGGLWKQVLLLKAATGLPSAPAVIGVGMLYLLLCTWILQSMGFAVWGGIAALFIVPALWNSWRSVVRQELLRPVSRAQLIRRIWLAMARDVLQVWLVVALVFVLYQGSFDGPADPRAWRHRQPCFRSLCWRWAVPDICCSFAASLRTRSPSSPAYSWSR